MSILKKLNRLVLVTCGLAVLTGPALAAPLCADATDMAAFRTAAVQQQLMVAALTCHDVEAYNRFVLAYQPELQKSDADLKAYFIRGGSEAAYDTFKTKLANLSSLSDIANGPAYCSNAAAAFDMALKSRQALSSFVADQRLMIAMPQQTTCTESRPVQLQTAALKPVKVAEAKPVPVSAPVKVPELKAPPVQMAAAKATPEPQDAVRVPAHALPASPYGARDLQAEDAPPPAPATYTYHGEDDADLGPPPPRPARPRRYQAARDQDYYPAGYAYAPPPNWYRYRWAPPPPDQEEYYGR